MAMELVRQRSDDPRWYRYWAQCAVYNGNAQEADEAMQLALEHHDAQDDKRNLYTSVAWAYRNTGNLNKAIAYAHKAMAIEPDKDFPNLWEAMGRFELERGRFDAAEGWYRRALAVTPENVNLLFSLARVSIARGETDVALQQILDGVQLLPEVKTKDFLPVSTYVLNGDMAMADSIFAANAETHVAEPNKWGALFDDIEAFPPGLVWSYMLRGDVERANSVLAMGESMEMSQRSPAVHIARGWMRLAQGDLDGARRSFLAGMDVGYNQISIRYALAKVAYLAGELDESERWIQEALDAGPNHIVAIQVRARIESARGNWGKALEYAEQSVAMDSTRASKELLSWVLVAGNLDIDRGIRVALDARQLPIPFTDIERKLPYRENAEHTLGLAYLKKGSTRQAVDHLRRAIAEQPNRASLQTDLQRALERTADTE
jgi:tetratricopeptide (TPR) repeat protein